MPYIFEHLDSIRKAIKRSSFGLITDIDVFRAIHAACHDLDFRGFAIGVTSQEMPEKLTEEADFTLNGVNDVERFLEWLSQIVADKLYS